MKADCAIIGGGIVGLSVALQLTREQPGLRVVVLEKEARIAAHQTGRNSGVIHSGIYYPPGSLKARFARDGNRSMVEFCRTHGIAHEVCGKVIVAIEQKELPLLEDLRLRGEANGLTIEKISTEEVREVEPHVRCLAGLRVPATGIVSYTAVCARLVELLENAGGIVETGRKVEGFAIRGDEHILQTRQGEIETRFFVNCGGLQSDRIARCAGESLEAQIVPFRGEYYELRPERRGLVRALIYPVPDPSFPFLGVHFTRMIDGSVHAGPNAVLALQREGYRKRDFNLRDVVEMLTYRGLWNLARKHYQEGFSELHRSLSKQAFVKSLQRLIPEIVADDLVPANAGVRAQALLPGGTLVNDFLLRSGRSAIHVCNAPSPAATAALEIAKAVVAQIPKLRRATMVSLASVSA